MIDVLWAPPGHGHRSRAEGIASALRDMGFAAEVVDTERGNPTVHETPARHAPFDMVILRHEFWTRAAFTPGICPLPCGIQWRALGGTAAEVRAMLDWADIAVVGNGQTAREAEATLGAERVYRIRTAADQDPCEAEADDPLLGQKVAYACTPYINAAATWARQQLGSVRAATPEDWARVYAMRDGLAPSEHVAFCATHDILIAEVCGEWAGYVRFDGPVISIALLPRFRGHGLSPYVLRAAMELRDLPYYAARVRSDNEASLALFRGLGFTEEEMGDETLFALHHAGHEA